MLFLGPMVEFIGGNNSGKTNLLFALQIFFGGGKLGVEDFWCGNKDEPVTLEARFDGFDDKEKQALESFLLDGDLEVRREATFDIEEGRATWETCYRVKEPKDPDLKQSKFESNKDRLMDIVTSKGLPDYFRGKTTEPLKRNGVFQ